MSDYNTNAGGRPQGGRGRGNRRRGGPPRGNSGGPSHRGGIRPNRKPAELTGLQKFLKIITFGLYSPQTLPQTKQSNRPQRESSAPAANQQRPERSNKGGDSPRKENRESRPPRQAPVSAEVSNERLYVGNLSYDATESDLFELFNGSGNVKNAEVVVNSRTQRSKGFAFVTMTSIEGAKKAVADLNSKDFMGRPLIVGGAKPLNPRDERRDEEAPATTEGASASSEVTV